MIRKIDRTLYGPSWAEVFFGAVLSVVLGAVLGALLLIVRPVEVVKQLPKEADRKPGAVYYIEGSRDGTRGREVPAKRKAFLEGQSVTVTEDHLNALIAANDPASKAPAPKPPPPPAKPGEKAAAPAAESDEWMALGTPNVRIGDAVMQLSVPITFNAMGLSRKVVAQARGTFVKRDGRFAFEPAEILVGACPVQSLPYVGPYARSLLLNIPVPDDIKEAWGKLADVAIEGRTLKLTVP